MLFFSFLSPRLSFANQSFIVLFRMRQFRENCGKLIKHLVPALELTTLFCVFHGLVSDEGQFPPAITKVFNRDHVIGAIDGFMFYSIVLRLNFVSIGVREVHAGDDLLVRNNLVVFAGVLMGRETFLRREYPSGKQAT